MRKWVFSVCVFLAPPVFAQGTPPPPATPSVTYVGVDKDVTDFQAANFGKLGYWFPQFDASGARSQKPTEENERNNLPLWAGPMTHMLIWQVWKFPQRTFSQDGPCKSKGGWASWNYFTLPNGDFGLSGIILDPHGADNTSQTVNRINLGQGTPTTFLLRIVVDNTDLKHNPINRIRARGEHNGVHIDPPTYPKPGMAAFNGTADVYTFRYDGFASGDFIKIQLNGMPGGTNNGGSGGASFAGLMFDPVNPHAPQPAPIPPPQPQPVPPPPPQPTPPANPQPQPSPQPQPTGTTAPASTAAPGTAARKSSGGSCAISARPGGGAASPFLLLVLLAGLALRGRSRCAD